MLVSYTLVRCNGKCSGCKVLIGTATKGAEEWSVYSCRSAAASEDSSRYLNILERQMFMGKDYAVGRRCLCHLLDGSGKGEDKDPIEALFRETNGVKGWIHRLVDAFGERASLCSP